MIEDSVVLSENPVSPVNPVKRSGFRFFRLPRLFVAEEFLTALCLEIVSRARLRYAESR
jgi:hypothetical protein